MRRYIECGGTLLVHGQNVPAVFSQGGVADGQGGYFVGFGHAAASLAGGESDWDATYKKLAEHARPRLSTDRKPAQSLRSAGREATVPVRGLFVLVLLFGVGIGPVNIWLLSRYKRRIWLWWNVPAISLLTCLAVFCYSSFSEGWTGHGKIASLTLLDERCHRATTIGYLSYYCPLTPSVGPRFGVDTDVALLDEPAGSTGGVSLSGGYAGLRFVDWTSDQHLTSGWVTARVPAYFQIRKNEDRRERLTVEKNGGRVADGRQRPGGRHPPAVRGRCARAECSRAATFPPAPSGRSRPLPSSRLGPEGGQADSARRLFASRRLARPVFAVWHGQQPTTLAAMLTPGCYVAILDKSPFVETPLDGVDSEDTVAIVYGISKGPDDGR